MKVGGSFEILQVVRLEHGCHGQVGLEAALCVASAPVAFALHKCFLEIKQILGRLVEAVLHALLGVIQLLEVRSWIDDCRCGLVGQIEEVNVRLHVPFLQKFDD